MLGGSLAHALCYPPRLGLQCARQALHGVAGTASHTATAGTQAETVSASAVSERPHQVESRTSLGKVDFWGEVQLHHEAITEGLEDIKARCAGMRRPASPVLRWLVSQAITKHDFLINVGNIVGQLASKITQGVDHWLQGQDAPEVHARRLAILKGCFLEALTAAVEQHLLSQAEHQEKEELHEQVVLKLQAAMTLLRQQSKEQLQAQALVVTGLNDDVSSLQNKLVSKDQEQQQLELALHKAQTGLQAAEKLAASDGQAHQADIAALKQELMAAAQAADHQKHSIKANDADLEKVTEVHQQEIQALEEAHQEELQQAEEEHQSLMQQLLQEGAQLQQDLEQEQQSIRDREQAAEQEVLEAAEAHKEDIASIRLQLTETRQQHALEAEQNTQLQLKLAQSEREAQARLVQTQELEAEKAALVKQVALKEGEGQAQQVQQQMLSLAQQMQQLQACQAHAQAPAGPAVSPVPLSKAAAAQQRETPLQLASVAWGQMYAQRLHRFQAWPGHFQLMAAPFNPWEYMVFHDNSIATMDVGLIGRGGIGECHYGQRRVTDASGAGQGWEAVCIKTFPFGPTGLQELQNLITVKGLALQHCIELLDCFFTMPRPTGEPGSISIITRLVEGQQSSRALNSLHLRLVKALPGSPRCSPRFLSAVKQVTHQALQALAGLHDHKTFHGDIKPNNLMVDMQPDGTGVLATLIDFGSADVFGTDWDEVANNSFYTSPEGLGNRNVQGMTGATDIWGLGCSFFELLTQWPLFAEAGDFSLQDQSCKAGENQRKQEHFWANRQLPPNVARFLKDAGLKGKQLQAIKDLLCDIFNYDPVTRPSARALMQHAFFQQRCGV